MSERNSQGSIAVPRTTLQECFLLASVRRLVFRAFRLSRNRRIQVIGLGASVTQRASGIGFRVLEFWGLEFRCLGF